MTQLNNDSFVIWNIEP